MARVRDTNAKSASLKGKIRDFFGPRPKPQEASPAPAPALVPTISRPIRIAPKKERKSTKTSNDENAPPSFKDPLLSVRRRADSNASEATIRPRGLKRQGSNDTIRADPPKRSSLAPKAGILTMSNKTASVASGGAGAVTVSAKHVSFDKISTDDNNSSSTRRHSRGIKPITAVSCAPPSVTTDFWNENDAGDTRVTILEVKTHKESLETALTSSAGRNSERKTHRRSKAISFSFAKLDQLDEGDEVLVSAKKQIFGEDSRKTTNLHSRLSKLVSAETTPSTPGRRSLKRTSSFMMASPTKDSLDDTFDAQFPDAKVITIDPATAKEDPRATDIREVGEVIRVTNMPPPSWGLSSRKSARNSTHGAGSLLSRFKVTIIPCQKAITLWDHSPNDVFIWSGLLCITDKEFKPTGFELRVPVKNIDIEFRSVDDNAKMQRVNGQPSQAEDPAGRPPAEFSVFYNGHSAPQSRVKNELAEHRGICIESAWRTGPFSLLSSDLDIQPPAETSYALKFYVPIPARLFTTGRESRYFNIKSKVIMGDYNLQPIPACSGIQKVLIEHLRREKHMDGKKGLPVARSHAKATSW